MASDFTNANYKYHVLFMSSPHAGVLPTSMKTLQTYAKRRKKALTFVGILLVGWPIAYCLAD